MEDEEIACAEKMPAANDLASDTAKDQPKRRPLPEHLPRNETALTPDTSVAAG